jgi:hypothetical protein
MHRFRRANTCLASSRKPDQLIVNEKPKFSVAKRPSFWNGTDTGGWLPTLSKIRNTRLPHREEVLEDPGPSLGILMRAIATVPASLSSIDPPIAMSKTCTPRRRPTTRTSDHPLNLHVATHPMALLSQTPSTSIPATVRIQPLTSTWISRTVIFTIHLSNIFLVPRRASSTDW